LVSTWEGRTLGFFGNSVYTIGTIRSHMIAPSVELQAITLITRPDGSVGTTGEVLLMRFYSEKEQQDRASFTQTPIQFGDTTW